MRRISFAIRLYGLLVCGLVCRASPIQLFTDRGAWYAAVNAAGLTNFGTESFEPFALGQYNAITDSGGAVFAPFVNIEPTPGGKVLRSNNNGVNLNLPHNSPNAFAYGFDLGLESVAGFPPVDHAVIFLPGVDTLVVTPGFVGLLSTADISGATIGAAMGSQPSFTTGVVLIDNLTYQGGPASAQTNPISPSSSCSTDCYRFNVPIGPAWFDPSTATGYQFASSTAKFTSINDFPTGFSAPFLVSVGGIPLGTFAPGQSVQFGGGGVSEFIVSGISPAVDGSSPLAFPINLSLDTVGASFTMQAFSTTDVPAPVPEPTMFFLVVSGITVTIMLRRRLN